MGIRAVGEIDGICDVIPDNSPFILYTKLHIFYFQKSHDDVGFSALVSHAYINTACIKKKHDAPLFKILHKSIFGQFYTHNEWRVVRHFADRTDAHERGDHER